MTARYRIYPAPSSIYIRAERSGRTICVARNNDVKPFEVSSIPSYSEEYVTAEVILGLAGGKSLILGTSSIEVVSNPSIRRLESFFILDLEPKDGEIRRKLLESVLKTPYLYYSTESDLTGRLLVPTQNSFNSVSDKEFVWNFHISSALFRDTSSFPEFFIPVIHGAVFSFELDIRNTRIKWVLISRRSRYRVGPRFFVRGIDCDGNVANFVETEQIVEGNGFKSSFVQTRGSIPLFWHQTPNVSYKPEPKLCDNNDMLPVKNHFIRLKKLYGGKVCCVDLVNHKKGEGRMQLAFKNAINSLKDEDLKYVDFDFHSECKASKGGWGQLKKLIDLLIVHRTEFGYYLKNEKDNCILKQQYGVFRTNCMDCLDRTNVVQSLLGTEHLQDALSRMNILEPDESILNNSTLQNLYKNAWADHANLISIQYSGTCALKTDFTRTGVRTKWGLVQDGWNSAIRYFFNNFGDGFRQDSLDFFMGNLTLNQIKKANNKELCRITLRKAPWLLKVFLVFFILATIFLPSEGNSLIIGLLFLVIIAILLQIKVTGSQYVNYPTGYDKRLSPPIQHGVKRWF